MKTIAFYGIAFTTIAFFLQSRAFFLGGAGSLMLIYGLTVIRKPRVQALLFGIYGIAVLVIAIFIKTDSSLGRVLIYKVSSKILFDKPWFGIGSGVFQRDYLLYQAAYFEKGNFTQKELLLADNTYFAFNDYFQLIVERGVFMLIPLALYFAVIYSITKHSLANGIRQKKNSIPIAIFNILSTSIAALFTHVFENPLWLVLVFLSFFVIFGQLVESGGVASNIMKAIVCCVLANFCIDKYHELEYQRRYRETEQLTKARYHKEALSGYQELSTKYRNRPWLLYTYGRYLLKINDPSMAAILIENSKKKISFNNQYLDLGDCYYHLKQFKKAEWHYKKSIYMVPNRFHNRYKLFRFYLLTEQKQKAAECAKSILTLPVKVPSHRVSFIKGEAAAFLKDFSRTAIISHSG